MKFFNYLKEHCLEVSVLCMLFIGGQSVFAQTQDMRVEKDVFFSGKVGKVLKAISPDQVTYFSIFSGPSLSKGNDSVDENGIVNEGSMSTWSQVSLRWRLNDKIMYMANPRFIINHNAVDEETESAELDDPVFGLNGQWYANGNWSIGGGLNTIVPGLRTEGTVDNGLLFNPGGFNSISYQVNNRLQLGTWVNARVLFYDQSIEANGDKLNFFLAPTGTYSFNDYVSATFFYQMNGATNNNFDTIFTEDDSFNLSASFRISQLLTLQPTLTVFRTNDYNAEDANFSMWLSGRIF